MLWHSFWNEENQCCLQNLHCHCGNDNNKICRMINDKKQVIFIRRMYQMKIKQKGKESQNNSAVTGLKKQKIFKEVGPRIEILTLIMEHSCKRTKFKLNGGNNH